MTFDLTVFMGLYWLCTGEAGTRGCTPYFASWFGLRAERRAGFCPGVNARPGENPLRVMAGGVSTDAEGGGNGSAMIRTVAKLLPEPAVDSL